MKLAKINQIIEDYHKLEERVEEVFSKICEIDKEYSIHRGIEKIYLERENVDITCDNSWGGCVDYEYYSFPIVWLSFDNDMLVEVVEAKKIEREELKRKKEEEKTEKERLEREEREYQKYLSLKNKFENK
jgi:hypothetical protein